MFKQFYKLLEIEIQEKLVQQMEEIPTFDSLNQIQEDDFPMRGNSNWYYRKQNLGDSHSLVIINEDSEDDQTEKSGGKDDFDFYQHNKRQSSPIFDQVEDPFDHNGNLFSGGDPGEQREIVQLQQMQSYKLDMDFVDPTEVEVNMIEQEGQELNLKIDETSFQHIKESGRYNKLNSDMSNNLNNPEQKSSNPYLDQYLFSRGTVVKQDKTGSQSQCQFQDLQDNNFMSNNPRQIIGSQEFDSIMQQAFRRESQQVSQKKVLDYDDIIETRNRGKCQG
eukprot:403374188